LLAPQKTTPKQLYEMVGDLRVELGSEAPDKKAAVLDSADKKFATLLPEIYRQAVISNNGGAYSGADIWKYFDEDLEDDLEKDANNTLFIVTDGYLDFENTEQRMANNNRFTSCTQIINALKKYPDWSSRFDKGDFGLLPTGKKFANLKIVLLQLSPKDNWNGEYSLLTKIWGKWFTEMGISSYHFIKEDNINEVRGSIEKFMQVKMSAKINVIPWTPIRDREVTNVITKDNTTTTITFSTVSANTAAVPAPEPVTSNSQKKIRTHRSKRTIETEPSSFDEQETEIGLGLKKRSATSGKPASKLKKQDDILNDDNPKKIFNTGIKKSG
jgi:hypothetical protein